MLRYADPRLCPDCRTVLPERPVSCPGCDLPLQHPLTTELFHTLQHADSLLDQLRAARVPVEAPITAPVVRRSGVRTASVPTILLGLGALCLLVAAVTFLAVAWSWMGIGGRTAVLVGLTATAAVAGGWMGRRGLTVAAESLTVVALGLVALDVSGAITAGWLGQPDEAASLGLVGGGIALVSGLLLTRRPRLRAPQLAAAGGSALALLSIAVSTGHDRLTAVVAVLLLGALATLGRRLGARLLYVSSALAAAAWWVWLLLGGFEDALRELTVSSLLTTTHALPLLAAAALLVGLAVVLDAERAPLALTGAATVLTFLVSVPVLDEGATALGLAALAALLAWAGVAALGPRTVAAGPLTLATLPALALSGLLVTSAAIRVWMIGGEFNHDLDLRLATYSPPLQPLLLLPLAAALLLALRVSLGRPRTVDPAVLVLLVAGLATLGSYAVPLAAVVAVLAVAALAAAGLDRGITAVVLVVIALSAALPSATLSALTAGVALAVAVLLHRAVTGRAMLPLAAGWLVWTVTEVAAVDLELRGLAVLVVVGLLALALPRVQTELAAIAAGLVASVVAVDAATDQPTSLAIHLTVAGALVTLSSLLHGERRFVAWPGGLLLASATWVRLADLGVEAPEAYTLPSAAVLVLAGLHRMRSSEAPTSSLLPGLVLATVPSLLWVLVTDPVTVRASLLGAACLGLVLVGSRLRWSAPLLVGAVVGGLLVVRELAPYAGNTPQWVLIGLAGTALTVVGVTWERRLLELRAAASYVGRLR